DADGRLRDRFPFGTAAEDIAMALQAAGPATGDTATAPSDAPAAAGGAAPGAAPAEPMDGPVSAGGAGGRRVRAGVARTIATGGPRPVILTITDGMGMPLDGTLPVRVRVIGAGGRPVGDDVPAVVIRPDGEQQVSYVATVSIPTPGSWRLELLGADGRTGSVS